MIIAIDYDGVIHDHTHPIPGKRMGAPLEGAREALIKLSKTNDIIIHTVWGDEKGRQVIPDWMKYPNFPELEITNVKPRADCYLDDKAIKHISWEQSLKDIHTLKMSSFKRVVE